MKKVIPEAERNETVNKGFLVDYLDEVLDTKLDQKFDIFEKKFDKKLEKYVTKTYLDMVLENQLKHIDQRIETLMEHQVHQLQVILESLDDRHVLRREWLASR